MMNSWSQCVITVAAFVSLFITRVAVADGVLYTIDDDLDVLVKIDLDAGTITNVGPLGVDFHFGEMAYDPVSQTMYLTGGLFIPNLYSVDLNTGHATLIGPTGLDDLLGLAYDTTRNRLWAAQSPLSSSLYYLEPSTGFAYYVTTMGHPIGGLAYNYNTDQLIGSHDGRGDLYEIDRITGQQWLLYDGPWVNDSGLAFDPSRNLLWGIDYSGVIFYYDVNRGYRRTDVRHTTRRFGALEWVGPINPYRLRASGVCPGTIQLTWEGATPNRTQAVMYGMDHGQIRVPANQPCSGTVLYLQNGVMLVQTTSTGPSGSGVLNVGTNGLGCRHFMQLLELGTCKTSNVAQLP